MTDLLFVYGTLRRGHSHPMAEALRRQHQFVGVGLWRGALYDLGPYPGGVTGDEDVVGDVYRLQQPEETLRLLDVYEGVNPTRPRADWYVREEHDIVLSDGRDARAWLYRYTGPVEGKRRIESGDYLADPGARPMRRTL